MARQIVRRVQIRVQGIVQGVGFRPFVYNLATGLALSGWVYNHPEGVDIEVEGEEGAVDRFLKTLRQDPPPLAVITDIMTDQRSPERTEGFFILESDLSREKRALISPDTTTCPDCLRELNDPGDRRYRYPFINCTNCGPRFTIVTGIPYDRERTTMAKFTMCPDCDREYHHPADRRFHAQPNACWECGPRLSLLDEKGEKIGGDDPLGEARRLLMRGAIVAVKGLGGFHLAVSAVDEKAVSRLRERKHREEKPLAVMVRDLEEAGKMAAPTREEEALLPSIQRPIVLIAKNDPDPLAPGIAPRNPNVGLMLPYTPLHQLLLEPPMPPLVMTSGNLSEEPLVYRNQEAFERLTGIADAFLIHDRDIHSRADDSVVRVIGGEKRVIRRSRGYVPRPILLDQELEQVAAVGGMLKNTFCLTKGRAAFLSQHIGDLENVETLNYLAASVDHFCGLLEITPRLMVCDLHPDYLSTRYAREQQRWPVLEVQHHHAHAAAVMAENNLSGPVIAVAFDGTGYGSDGAVWGGEFLVADYDAFDRWGYFDYRPLPGGEKAIKQPWRMLLAYLAPVVDDLEPYFGAGEPWKAVLSAVEAGVNSPPTSSAGRLFDGVSAFLGIRRTVAFEGQAAMELEAVVDRQQGARAGRYPFHLEGDNNFKINFNPMWQQIVKEKKKGIELNVMAARFHNTVAGMIILGVERIREGTGLKTVVLGGGVFQNAYLLERCIEELPSKGFAVYAPSQVPTNDGGLSLGQAVIGSCHLRRED